MKGFDCATPLTATSAAAFAADGYGIACRYLVPTGWKRLTKDEADAISEAGLQIVSVFEIGGDRASMNASQGMLDGESALLYAKEVGQPEGSTIYFAVDYDAQPTDMDSIEAYIRAAAVATPDYPTGVYGSYEVIEEMKRRGACSHFWQTYAWSHGQVSADIQIYQNDCGPNGEGLTVHGIGVDLNECYGYEGGWSTMPLIPVSDANKVIGLLSEAFKQGVTKITLPDGTITEVDQAEIHRLANVQRTASGQATT